MKVDIRRHTVWSFTDDLASESGWILLEAFRNVPGNIYMKGACEPPADYWPLVYQGIRNPLARLDAMLTHVKKQRALVEHYARMIKTILLTPGGVVYTAHDEDQRVVGFTAWEYPKHLHIRRECGQVGLCYQIYRLWYQIKGKVLAWWGQLTQLRPLDPQRHTIYREAVRAAYEPALDGLYVDDKTIGSFESLDHADAHYQHQDTVFLSLLAVLPDFQGKGVASQLLKHNIDEVPNVPTPISYGGVKKLGPQKFSLVATELAGPLYTRFGFKEYARSVTEFVGAPHSMAKMEMVRPPSEQFS